MSKYIQGRFVEVINVRGKTNQQISCYNKFYHTYAKNYDWVAYFDIDEFLIVENNDIQKFLSQSIYNKFDGVAVNWQQYDDNNIVKVTDSYDCLNRFTHIYEESDNKYSTYKCSKRILKTNKNLNINSSHGALSEASMKEYNQVGTNNIKICNTEGKEIENTIYFNNWTWSGAYLKHFRFKTIEEYITNKIKRGYPTLYKNGGKDINLNDFFSSNKVTLDKLRLAAKLLNQDESKLIAKYKNKLPKNEVEKLDVKNKNNIEDSALPTLDECIFW